MTNTPEENAALVRRFLTDVVAAGGTAAIDAFLTEDSITHTLVLMDLAPTGVSLGIDDVWFCRPHDGGIAEIWSLPDGLRLMNELGAPPNPSVNRSPTDQDQQPR